MSMAECAICANQLNETVKDKIITKVIANQNPHTFVWFALEPAYAFCSHDKSNEFAKEYDKYLVGEKIKGAAVNLGGYSAYTFMYVGSRALIFHVLAALYHEKDAKRPKRHQLLIEFYDGTALSFCGSLGGPLFLFEVDQNGRAVDYTSDFPNILSNGFSLEFFMNLIRANPLKSMSANEFLATKNRIPGFDNSILHEILWEAEVSPKTKMVSLGEPDFVRIFNSIKKIYPAVITAGGKDTDKDLYGQFGGYETRVSKKTLGTPCERCGGLVMKEAFLGGAVYYCPQCQPNKNNAKKIETEGKICSNTLR